MTSVSIIDIYDLSNLKTEREQITLRINFVDYIPINLYINGEPQYFDKLNIQKCDTLCDPTVIYFARVCEALGIDAWRYDIKFKKHHIDTTANISLVDRESNVESSFGIRTVDEYVADCILENIRVYSQINQRNDKHDDAYANMMCEHSSYIQIVLYKINTICNTRNTRDIPMHEYSYPINKYINEIQVQVPNIFIRFPLYFIVPGCWSLENAIQYSSLDFVYIFQRK